MTSLSNLQAEIDRLRAEVGRIDRTINSGHSRQPRLALTVPEPSRVPIYPPPPTPEVTDPDTGAVLIPEGEHANVFAIQFVDGQVPQTAGTFPPVATLRQFSSGAAGYVFNLADRPYLDPGTVIWVYEDGGYWWTCHERAGSGGSAPAPAANPPVFAFLQGQRLAGGNNIVASLNNELADWVSIYPSKQQLLQDFALDWDTGQRRLTALAPTELFGVATFELRPPDDTAGFTLGHTVEVQFNLQPYTAAGTPAGKNFILIRNSWRSLATSVSSKDQYSTAAYADVQQLDEDDYLELTYSCFADSSLVGDTFQSAPLLRLLLFRAQSANFIPEE